MSRVSENVSLAALCRSGKKFESSPLGIQLSLPGSRFIVVANGKALHCHASDANAEGWQRDAFHDHHLRLFEQEGLCRVALKSSREERYVASETDNSHTNRTT